ncbi:MAG TPA: M56 family metallopeptidase [Vicinamibacterales bacterium]|nr:M56 family metallopeptidase [Vicinamibacterales bacterium]
MTYTLLAAVITCSAFAIAVSIASALVGAAAPLAASRIARYAPASRASILFGLRMLPAGAGIGFALAVALPIFLWFEPRETQETVTLTLAVTAAAGVAVWVRGAARAFRAWRATRYAIRTWRQRGRRLTSFETSMPVFAIEESFPTVAVAGVARPVLFISERVLRECPDDEVRAMVAHERSHVARRDNLKRLLIRGCPDLLGAGMLVERAWSDAAEEAADAEAAAGRPDRALDLAQALIRVARLAPRLEAPALASAFYLGGSIESRIRRLVEPDRLPAPSHPLGCVAIGGLALALAAIVVTSAPALHQLMEAAVHFLP